MTTGPLCVSRGLLRVRQPHTVSGHLFTARSAILLNAIARSRRYVDNLWVPMAMVEPLALSVDESAEHAVRLDAMNGTCFYYHVSQFQQSPEEVESRCAAWRLTRRRQEQCSTSPWKKPDTVDAFSEPRNTNGETLGTAATTVLRQRFLDGVRWRSPYWATREEAAYIYSTPFREDYTAQSDRAVSISSPFAAFPGLTLFNVEGTVRQEAFSELSCRRYDSYNYQGQFYAPAISVAMKRVAVKHGCLHCARWMTTNRVTRFGCELLPEAEPLFLFIGTHLVTLVNVAQTTNPELLEACAVNAQMKAGSQEHNGSDPEDSLLLTSIDSTEEILPDESDVLGSS